ncbi:helix-turn-helix transcriptional regulator [Streptomyces glaucosporus]|uniref:Helix-turn-helix transcriptional regulator n=1 Tax=Streptomyces glaucosporus TaxID=284044 RepID=A0ABP5V4A5_9ACTN
MAERETEEFAEYVRGLKERSGHSYGTLARRLHTSTSTLHRYCNGAAVPARYAPVERLARLCGATEEELLELHRRWLRADATRGRTEPEGQVLRREAEPEQDGDSRPEHGQGHGPEGGAPEPGTVPGAVPAPDSVPGTGDPIPVPARRRRAFLWPAAAVLAVALLVAAAVQTVSGRSDRDVPSAGGSPVRLESPAPDAPPSAPATPSGSSASSPSSSFSPSPSPSPSPSSASSAPGGNGRRNGGPGPSPFRRADGGRRESPHGAAPGAAPLSWTARSHVWRYGCDHRYLIDLPPSRVPPPPVAQDAAGWAGSLGAVHGGETIVEATVHGTGRSPVVVESAHVRVAARRTPLARSSFGMSEGCGGSLTPAALSVDLDAPRPLARPMDGYDGDAGKELPAVRLPYRVTADDPLALRIEARTEGCDCDWYLELRWSSGGDSGTLRVDDAGRPFRTSAAKGRPAYGWSTEDGAWRTG